jgi:hypothetical protein
VRKHWSIENQLHWCLDVIFHEDDSRAKKDNSPIDLFDNQKFTTTIFIQRGSVGVLEIINAADKRNPQPKLLLFVSVATG